ncbi:MAG: preprotein translocase subunit SecG [Patescibacteria group bacterium]
MQTFLQVFQIVISVLLILCILTQQRSTGLSLTFGGNNASFQSTKRGPEKVLSQITVVLAVLFVLSSLAFLFV